jgi:hypothetical protein
MNEIKVSINRNGLLYKKITDTIDFNKQDINIFINDKWRKYMGGDIENSSKLQGYFVSSRNISIH